MKYNGFVSHTERIRSVRSLEDVYASLVFFH